jgi:hypothetical protein
MGRAAGGRDDRRHRLALLDAAAAEQHARGAVLRAQASRGFAQILAAAADQDDLTREGGRLAHGAPVLHDQLVR